MICTCISIPHNSTVKNEANEKPGETHDLSPVILLWERVMKLDQCSPFHYPKCAQLQSENSSLKVFVF